MDARIIINAIETPDGTVLISAHRHDYRDHTDANGSYYAVDGGHDYLKRSSPGDHTELSIIATGAGLRRTPNPSKPPDAQNTTLAPGR